MSSVTLVSRGQLVCAALVLCAVDGAASANPACDVEVVTAPEDVKAQIEEWVRGEERCAVKLAIRVVKTTGGLYVLGTEPTGRSRDRVVPDGLTAAVLVASWVADDGSRVAPPPPALAPVPAPPPATIVPSVETRETYPVRVVHRPLTL